LILATIVTGGALAQESVDPSDLKDAFSQLIPRGWLVTDFSVEAQENYGTAIEPDIRSRFSATVTSQADTYVPVGRLGNATLLGLMASTGEKRTYYGIAASQRQGGGWSTRFNLENDPTEGVGQPKDAYPGRVIVRGSDEEAAFRAELAAQERAAHEVALQEEQREEELRAQARVTELADAAHAVALKEAELEAKRKAEVEREAHEAAMQAQLREQEAAQRAAREKELTALMAPLPEEVRKRVAVELPAFWSLNALLNMRESVGGSFDAPVVMYSFDAAVTLQEDLFEAAGTFAGRPLTTRVEEAGAGRTIQGAATATWINGRWGIELNPIELGGLLSGNPRDQFVAQAIATGTPEEAAFRQSVASEQARVSQDLSDLEATLTSSSSATRGAALAQALASGNELLANMALRDIVSRSTTLAVRLSLFDEDVGDEKMQEYLNAASGLGLKITSVDLASGAFQGSYSSGLSFLAGTSAKNFSGVIAGTSLATTQASGYMRLELDLVNPRQLEGIFMYRSSRPLRAVIDLQ